MNFPVKTIKELIYLRSMQFEEFMEGKEVSLTEELSKDECVKGLIYSLGIKAKEQSMFLEDPMDVVHKTSKLLSEANTLKAYDKAEMNEYAKEPFINHNRQLDDLGDDPAQRKKRKSSISSATSSEVPGATNSSFFKPESDQSEQNEKQ